MSPPWPARRRRRRRPHGRPPGPGVTCAVNLPALVAVSRSGSRITNCHCWAPRRSRPPTCLAAAAEYERDLIGARTREGMAQRRAEGVHVGRPTAVPVEIVTDIVRARAQGATLAAIAATLNAAAVPTGHDAPAWTTSNVAGVLRSTSARRLATQTSTEVG